MSEPIKGKQEVAVDNAKADLKNCLKEIQRTYGNGAAARAISGMMKDLLEFDHVIDFEEPLSNFLKKGPFGKTWERI